MRLRRVKAFVKYGNTDAAWLHREATESWFLAFGLQRLNRCVCFSESMAFVAACLVEARLYDEEEEEKLNTITEYL
jgi:hypothetical protein